MSKCLGRGQLSLHPAALSVDGRSQVTRGITKFQAVPWRHRDTTRISKALSQFSLVVRMETALTRNEKYVYIYIIIYICHVRSYSHSLNSTRIAPTIRNFGRVIFNAHPCPKVQCHFSINRTPASTPLELLQGLGKSGDQQTNLSLQDLLKDVILEPYDMQ